MVDETDSGLPKFSRKSFIKMVAVSAVMGGMAGLGMKLFNPSQTESAQDKEMAELFAGLSELRDKVGDGEIHLKEAEELKSNLALAFALSFSPKRSADELASEIELVDAPPRPLSKHEVMADAIELIGEGKSQIFLGDINRLVAKGAEIGHLESLGANPENVTSFGMFSTVFVRNMISLNAGAQSETPDSEFMDSLRRVTGMGSTWDLSNVRQKGFELLINDASGSPMIGANFLDDKVRGMITGLILEGWGLNFIQWVGIDDDIFGRDWDSNVGQGVNQNQGLLISSYRDNKFKEYLSTLGKNYQNGYQDVLKVENGQSKSDLDIGLEIYLKHPDF